MWQFYLIEALLLLWLTWTTWRIMRNPFRVNVVRMCVMAIGFGTATLIDQPVSALLSVTCTNFITGIVILLLCSITVYFAVIRFVSNRIKARGIAFAPSSPTRTLQGRLVNLILVLVVFGLVIGLTDFLVGLAAMCPQGRDIKDHSLFLHVFLPHDEATLATQGEPSLTSTMDEQAHFLSGLRGGLTASRTVLARTLGTEAAMEQLRRLVTLLNLPREETAWLIDNTPELKHLAHNRHLNDITTNDAILNQIVAAGQGSMSALYQLGDEPAIKALFEDPDITSSIKSISLSSLEQAINRHRQISEHELPTEWETSEIALPTDVTAALNDRSRWRSITNVQGCMTWGQAQRLCLLRTSVSSASCNEATLCIQSTGVTLCWLNETTQPLQERYGRKECNVSLNPEITVIVLMIDFRETPPPKQCRIRLLTH